MHGHIWISYSICPSITVSSEFLAIYWWSSLQYVTRFDSSLPLTSTRWNLKSTIPDAIWTRDMTNPHWSSKNLFSSYCDLTIYPDPWLTTCRDRCYNCDPSGFATIIAQYHTVKDTCCNLLVLPDVSKNRMHNNIMKSQLKIPWKSMHDKLLSSSGTLLGQTIWLISENRLVSANFWGFVKDVSCSFLR